PQRVADPGRLVAAELGLGRTPTVRTTSGGNMPQALVTRTAADVLAGTVDLAAIGGVECWRTLMRYRRQDLPPPWAGDLSTDEPDDVYGDELLFANDHERAIGLVQPVNVYPLFETAL